jgi:hypothetical protein
MRPPRADIHRCRWLGRLRRGGRADAKPPILVAISVPQTL